MAFASPAAGIGSVHVGGVVRRPSATRRRPAPTGWTPPAARTGGGGVPPPPPTDAQREAWRRQVAAFGDAAASAASSPDVQAALTKMSQAAAAAAGSPAVQSVMADMANEFLRNAEGGVDGGGGTPWARPPPPETTQVRPPTSSQPATPPSPPSPSPSRSPQPQPPSPPAGASTAPWPAAWGVPTPAGRVDWVPRAELAETPTAYTWRVELPGVAKADVRTELRAADREVRVAGVKRRPGGDGGGGGGWPRGEVAYGSFGRSLALPADADVADRSSMRAAVRDGVLTVSVAKVAPSAAAADEAGVDIPVV